MSIKCILAEQVKLSGTGEDVVLQSIAITTPPTKVIYQDGETFDPTGMVVTGTYYVTSQDIYITAEITAYNVSPTTIITGTTQVTISYSEGSHNVNTIQNIVVGNWEWGDETATGAGNATWWQGLQQVTQAGFADSSWIGKTKSVTLTSSVLGTTTHLVQCIGVNEDGNNTVTFQTMNCLANIHEFDNAGSVNWNGSGARTQCQNYYNAFPGKSYIKTVSKGTYIASQNLQYYNETVWLPSMSEVGQGDFSYSPGAEYTNGCSTAYSYYSDNNSRKKKANDNVDSYSYWWTRSRGSAYHVCSINPSGAPTILDPDNTLGLAPAFVIG